LFFFSSRRRHTRFSRDWSSDVCSSDLEHVTRISFTAWRTAQQQGDLTISPGLFGQVVINDERVLTAVTVVFTDSTTGKRSQELHGGRIRCGSCYYHRVFHCAMLFQFAYHCCNRR